MMAWALAGVLVLAPAVDHAGDWRLAIDVASPAEASWSLDGSPARAFNDSVAIMSLAAGQHVVRVTSDEVSWRAMLRPVVTADTGNISWVPSLSAIYPNHGAEAATLAYDVSPDAAADGRAGSVGPRYDWWLGALVALPAIGWIVHQARPKQP